MPQSVPTADAEVAQNGTDGFVSDVIANWICKPKELDALERVGLFKKVGVGEVKYSTGRVSNKPDAEVVMADDGFWLPAYLMYNLTAQEGEALSARGRKGGQASAASRADKPDSQQQVQRQVEQQADLGSNRQVRSSQVTSGDVNPALTGEERSLYAGESAQGRDVRRARGVDPLDVLADEVRL